MYQFIFAAIRRTDLTNHIVKIRINADTEQEARKPLAREFVLVLAGRINLQNTVKTDRTFLIQDLPTVQNGGSIGSTTTYDGNRNRHSSGIFLSQIHPLNVPQNWGALSFIEFAVRATRRNKALCANNAGCSYAVVEPLSHSTTSDISLLTKHTRQTTMKIYPQNNRTLATFPALSVSAEMEVAHA